MAAIREVKLDESLDAVSLAIAGLQREFLAEGEDDFTEATGNDDLLFVAGSSNITSIPIRLDF